VTHTARVPGAARATLVAGRHEIRPAVVELLRELGRELIVADSAAEFRGAPAGALSAVVLLGEPTATLTSTLACLGALAPEAPAVLVCEELGGRALRCALSAGVAGVVLSGELDSALPACLAAVEARQVCVPWRGRTHIDPPVLSLREKQILGLVVMGCMNSEIAQQLFLAESTVKSHLSSAFAKLGVHSRSEAADLILDPESGLGTGILALGCEPLAPPARSAADPPQAAERRRSEIPAVAQR
jgi:DNA-binding NarL/FixJ family response regulator